MDCCTEEDLFSPKSFVLCDLAMKEKEEKTFNLHSTIKRNFQGNKIF